MNFEFYVSPMGNDDNSGTIDSPVRTLTRARDLARKYNKTDSVIVYLREGDYPAEKIGFSSTDSYVSYSAYKGEKVRIIGGVKLTNERLKKVEDEKLLNRIIDKSVRDKVYEIDVSDLKDALYPILPSRDKSYLATGLFRNNDTMEPARYPKRGKETYNGESFGYMTRFKFLGDTNASPAEITLKDDLAARTALWDKDAVRDLWMFGFFKHQWADETQRIVSIDVENHKVTSDGYKFIYGLECDEDVEKRCYFFNVFDELSKEREYYIDREKGIIYLISDGNIDKDEIYLAYNDGEFFKISNAINIDFTNIEFVYSHSRMISLCGCRNVTFYGCTFAHGSDNAMYIEKSTDISVDSCDVYDFLRGGIMISACGDTHNLIPSNIVIENCIMHDVARTIECYVPCISVRYDVIGVKMLHNTLFNSPHNLINMTVARNCEIAYNEFYNGSTDTDDAALIYWGRNPSTLGHIIHHNYFHHCQYEKATWGTAAIYQDDQGTGADIYNNIFYKVGSPVSAHAIKGTQFHNNHDNIFINENPPAQGTWWGYNRWIVATTGSYATKERTKNEFERLNRWNEILVDEGFFTEKWKRYYKNTFWEFMYQLLSDENMAKINAYKESIKDEDSDLQNAKLEAFTTDMFWSHTLMDGTRYEGSFVDMIRDKFPEHYSKAIEETEGKEEAARIFRITYLMHDLYWENKIKATYSTFCQRNLTVGVSHEFIKDGVVVGAPANNGYPAMTYMNCSDNYNMDSDILDSGKSIFKKFGEDFTLTDEGLAFVQSKIKGFERIEQSEIGAKRR